MVRRLIYITIVVLLFGAAAWRYTSPLPQLQAEIQLIEPAAPEDVELSWPAYGQAAFGAVGYGVLSEHNTDSPAPIASIAKAITALAILDAKPLAVGQQGPRIAITDKDVQGYLDYLAINGSVVPVESGQRITQYQALQAMLLPSANNIADTAAVWAFGSAKEYVEYANRFVVELGMNDTEVADASGFSPRTTSTAADLVRLGEAVLNHPIASGIVKQGAANFPGVGRINNVNWLLGTDGVVGIKTGNTDQAGGCFLFGAKRQIAGRSVTVIGAILGAETRNIAMTDSRELISEADSGFHLVTAVPENQVVARYYLPWGGSVEAVTSSQVKTLAWKSSPAQSEVNLNELAAPAAQDSVVGSVKLVNGGTETVPVKLKQPVQEPSWLWRLFRY